MKAVIVSFTFPPFGGIGGRRWAKFCKYLFRNGTDFQVLAAQRDLHSKSPWTHDIAEYEDRITYLKDGYPKVLSTIPSGIVQKIKYRLALMYVKTRIRNGNYYDPSFFFNLRAKKEVVKAIESGAGSVIITCAPFRTGYEIVQLKKKYPNVDFIVDFRDPWVNNQSHYGLYSQSESRKRFESGMEKETIRLADKVFAVSEEMIDYFVSLNVADKNKFRVIPNGFDTEDIPKTEASADEHILRFVFTGNFYDHCEHLLLECVTSITKMIEKDPEIAQIIKMDFYGAVPSYFAKHTASLPGIFRFHGKISLNQVYHEIRSATLCSLFLTDDMAYTRSTKYYEYLGMKKPIAVFSKGEGTGKYLQQNHIGFDCASGRIQQSLEKIFLQWKAGELSFDPTYQTNSFDVKNIALKIENILNQNIVS